ncbi:restriction endonuclease subunit S [Modicisalibacter sp. 'Wilcox']|uniref:restriction endonuclease subunit S n=1 Tax=Modicisalibacter sp. 'Wilcox' TaxID=2679914 RepID=UPI0013D1CD37|nr:restriction endonuclease subunit S [Modicisalibacter sp. 'Wilcox']
MSSTLCQEWEQIALGDLGRIVTGRTPPSSKPELFGDKYPFITPTDMAFSDRSIWPERGISDAGAESLSRIKLPPKTPCFVCIGATIGKLCLTSEESFTNQQINSIVVDQKKHSPEFVYYLLCYISEHVKSLAGGAATPIINKTAFSEVPVVVPSLETQKAIASVLAAYDDLIENNTRRIKILEEMARRLYEEWFVHFRFPGHEKVSFKESELGEIPEGWEIKELGDVAQINPEVIKPKSAPDEIHYIDIASVSPGQIDKAETMQFANAPGRARRIVRSGDVLWSCVRPNRRSCAMIVEPRENTVASTGFAVLRAGSVSKHYLYQHVRADQFVSYLVNRATGAAYPAVKAADFKEAKIIVPKRDILSDFDKAVAPMRSLIHRLDRKNANLRAQRDLLLPKLVSGEIDVSDITMPEDKEVEAA